MTTDTRTIIRLEEKLAYEQNQNQRKNEVISDLADEIATLKLQNAALAQKVRAPAL